MKIHGFLLLLLGSVNLVASQTDVTIPSDVLNEFPNCVRNSGCLSTAAEATCGSSATTGCICSSQVAYFFYYMIYCAYAYSCTDSDVNTAAGVLAVECNKYGYDVEAGIKTYLGQNVNPTFSYNLPSVSNIVIPTWLDTPSGTTSGSSDPATSSSSSKSSGLSTGAIIGVVVGAVAVIAIIAGVIVFCMKHRAKQSRLNQMSTTLPTQQLPPHGPPPVASPYSPPPQMPYGPPPPQMPYGSPPPQGYFANAPPIYPHQQQPLVQQQTQPLMQGYQELEQPNNGYYSHGKGELEGIQVSSVPSTATPAPLPPGHGHGQAREYFQELPAQEGHRGHDNIGQVKNEHQRVYQEMPGNGER